MNPTIALGLLTMICAGLYIIRQRAKHRHNPQPEIPVFLRGGYMPTGDGSGDAEFERTEVFGARKEHGNS